MVAGLLNRRLWRGSGLRLGWPWYARYALPVGCVIVATVVAMAFQYDDVRDRNFPFFLAVALSAWLAGAGPACLALVLSVLAVEYSLIPPLYRLPADLPSFIAFIASAAVMGTTARLAATMAWQNRPATSRRQAAVGVESAAAEPTVSWVLIARASLSSAGFEEPLPFPDSLIRERLGGEAADFVAIDIEE